LGAGDLQQLLTLSCEGREPNKEAQGCWHFHGEPLQMLNARHNYAKSITFVHLPEGALASTLGQMRTRLLRDILRGAPVAAGQAGPARPQRAEMRPFVVGLREAV
jgi:hypothetical protein